jgi:hypothetical protein
LRSLAGPYNMSRGLNDTKGLLIVM